MGRNRLYGLHINLPRPLASEIRRKAVGEYGDIMGSVTKATTFALKIYLEFSDMFWELACGHVKLRDPENKSEVEWCKVCNEMVKIVQRGE